MSDDEEEQGPRCSFEVYKAEADAFFILGEYHKAIANYTTALEVVPGQRDCLVARSRCYLKLGDIPSALKDAEDSLKEDKDFHRGIFQKAEVLFYKGDFETALVFYHRGSKLRPELDEFRLGIQKAEEAIDYAAGSPDKVTLTTKGDLSFFTEQTMSQVRKKPTKKAGGLFGRQVEEKKALKRQINRNARCEASMRKVMGQLYPDRIYLEKLMKETDESTDTGKQILQIIETGLQYLDTRTDFWRQQMPLYARAHELQMKHKGRSDVGVGDQAKNFVLLEMDKIEKARASGQHHHCLSRCQRLLHTLSKYSKIDLEEKTEIEVNVKSILGDIYLDLGKEVKALEYHHEALNIGRSFNLEFAVSRALSNLGRVYARIGRFQKAIDYWERKINRTTSAQERAWLFHEIGRCYLELKNLKKAMSYGQKSLQEAIESKDKIWEMQALVLIAQTNAKLSHFEDALELFNRALKLARKLEDQKFEVAIFKVIDEVKMRIVEKRTMDGLDEQLASSLAFAAIGRPGPSFGAPKTMITSADDKSISEGFVGDHSDNTGEAPAVEVVGETQLAEAVASEASQEGTEQSASEEEGA